MSYLAADDVNAWLQQSKFKVIAVDTELESTASLQLLAKLAQRYDTTTWVDSATTPELAVRIMAMLVASYVLRRAISEDTGESTYPDWLEGRANLLLDSIIDGTIGLPGFEPNPNATLADGAEFFPTDAATQLWADGYWNEPGAAALHFTSQDRF